MKVAIFADIHSNFHALEACISHALQHNAKIFIILGDFLTDLSYPKKTMDLIYALMNEHPCFMVKGNREAYLLDQELGKTHFTKGSKSGSLFYTYKNLRQKDLDFFKQLPIYQTIQIENTVLEIAHSTCNSDRFYFTKKDTNIDQVFDLMKTNLLLTAHSHEQYQITKDGKTIINPGSIGVPLHSKGLTQYALLDITDKNFTCELLQIPYNIQQTIIDQFESGLVDTANYWALSILYNIITGENVTIDLLNRVAQYAKEKNTTTLDESVWEVVYKKMGLHTNLEDILKEM